MVPSAICELAAAKTLLAQGKKDEEECRRAVPVNYLDVEMDEAFIDWMGCHSADNEMECLEENYEDRWMQVTQTVHNQSMVTDYAGLLDDGFKSLSVPEGVTVILAASSSWLGFLTKLQDAGIPPIPLVLQIIDQYIPMPTFSIPNNDNNDNADGTLWLLDACRSLDHLYSSRASGATPTLGECFELYTPPSPNWTFDARALASELDNRVFQPSRRGDDWMRKLHSLTRLFGRLDAATAGRGSDPYLALASGKPTTKSNFTAVAAPVCQAGDPISWELSIAKGGDDEKSPLGRTFWQDGQFSCPVWEPMLDGPIFDDPAAGKATDHSMALSVNAWAVSALDGDIQVTRNASTGGFDPKAIEEASRFGRAQLEEALALQAEAAALASNEGDDANNGKSDSDGLQQSSAVSMVVRNCSILLVGTLFLVLR